MVVQREVVVSVQEQGEDGLAASWLSGPALTGRPSLSSVAKYFCLLCWTPREKSSVEQEVKEKEEAIRQRSSEVQVRCSWPPFQSLPSENVLCSERRHIHEFFT